ncbi:MAG TPA: hypothetical protein PLU24_04270, partial [Candidatus Omnitrophota bacterium]|nr:hypothetical protein [Candidatus Omnitrophota bacterium]
MNKPAGSKNLFWIFALSSAIYFTQGIETLPSQSLFYYLKETLKFSPEKIMTISGIIALAWLVKPLIGYLVDNFFNKKIWIYISLFFSMCIALSIVVSNMTINVLIGVLILSSAWAAFRDVSVDGIMCVEGKKSKITGKIQSVQWISVTFATLLTGIGGGYIAQKWSYKTAFLMLLPFYMAAWAFTWRYKTDEPVKKET